MDVRVGDVLVGKYRVDGILGSGGIGRVVAATHLHLDQTVALKYLRPEVLDNEEAVARFLLEAKAVVKLRSEHVARVFDVGVFEDGSPYIVMEHLEGCDLHALCKVLMRLPVPQAVDYVMQACEALAEAHARGLTHRDLKPANLFLTHDAAGLPRIKVLDFGIAKQGPVGQTVTNDSLTMGGSLLGSPHYMAPEQIRSPRDVDARSDIWSIGVVLYRLVSGAYPFDGATVGEVIHRVYTEPPRPLSAHGAFPPDFEATVLACLEKDPARRFRNVAELAAALVRHAPQGIGRARLDTILRVMSAASTGALAGTPADSNPSQFGAAAYHANPNPTNPSYVSAASGAPPRARVSDSLTGGRTRDTTYWVASLAGITVALALAGAGAAVVHHRNAEHASAEGTSASVPVTDTPVASAPPTDTPVASTPVPPSTDSSAAPEPSPTTSARATATGTGAGAGAGANGSAPKSTPSTRRRRSTPDPGTAIPSTRD